MDKVLKLYKLVNGVEQPFPNRDEQIITSDFTYSAKRMGGAPSITCTVRHKKNLDDSWDEKVYAKFNDERYYLRRTPTNTYDNTDVRYKYDVELVSERIILDSVYFMDVDPMLKYKGVTNSPSFSFHGDIRDFAQKLNHALRYAGLQTEDKTGNVNGYQVIVGEGINTDKHLINFENQYISSSIQEIYNTFNLPYYFKGKEIHIGEADKDKKLDTVLKYGDKESLLSISKQNANHMVINRITGTGSSDNIPYYYPNETPLGKVAVRAIQSNTNLNSDSFFEIVNVNKLGRLGLKEESNDGNVVVLKKLEPNTIVYPIISYDYLHIDTTGAEVWKGAFLSDWDNTIMGMASAYASEIKGKYKERLITYKYHVRLQVQVSKNQGGLMRWIWRNNPNWDTISEQKRKNGDFIEKFFDNLEAYEIVNNEERKINATIVGTYPSLYIQTPFIGSSNGTGRNVDIHLKFEFSKLELGSLVETQDIALTNFANIELVKEDVGDRPYYWESPKASYADIREFGVDLSGEAKEMFLLRPDELVGEGFYLQQESWIAPQPNLMPPIYRENFHLGNGTDRFYSATDNTYPIDESDVSMGYYKFPNPYVEGQPQEHIQSFEDIKPEIDGIVNGHGDPINKFLAFAYDEGDNDSLDEDGNPLHPYFFAKLASFSQIGGEFNLFDHAIESGPMQITMTSGQCSGCTFQIMVNKDTQKNTVQVDSDGNLVRDDKGNVVVVGPPQDRQNDTINNTVWIALHKDMDTLPSIMPNMGSYNKPSTDDTFAILNISMPQAYIVSAEKRLEQALLKYMLDNNVEKFNFSVKFSRIYLGEHSDVVDKLCENSSVVIEYNGTDYPLYISSYTYKMKSGEFLPEISVELTDTLSIQQGTIQQAVSQAKGEILNIIASADPVRKSVPYFLRKDINDEAVGRITFKNGFNSDKDASFGNFRENSVGAGIFQDASGNWHMEADFMRVRKKLSASTVEIEESHHIGGSQMLTSASAVIEYVVDKGAFYRCYFLKTDESGRSIQNKWVVNDQAFCRYFNLASNEDGVIDRFYWRKVVGTDNTVTDNTTLEIDGVVVSSSNYHFIDLSKDVCKEGSDVPKPQDNIVQLGHNTKVAEGEEDPNASRKNAIIMAGAGEGSPYICQYVGIDSFFLPAPDTQIKPNDNVFTGKTVFKKGSSGLENIQEWAEKQEQLDKATEASETALGMASTVTEDIQSINSKLDGVIIHHFEAGQPTANNYPANTWNTYELKKQHIGDTYTNTRSYEDDESGGKSWRWVENDGSFTWEEISENDAVKALQKAKDAQTTADGKTRTFIGQPYPPYDTGDLWSQGANAPLQICIKSKSNGYFDAGDWALADNAQAYTDALRNEIEAQIQNTTNALQGKIDEANSLIGKNGEYAKELDAAIKALEESQASVDEIVEEVLKDGKITNLEQTAMNAATEAANAAMAVYDELVKALADDNYIDDEEAAKIAGAMAIWEKAQKYAEEKAKEAKQEAIDEINNTIENLESTNGNLIRNSGFTGDYITAELQSGSSLKDAFAMFSPSLKHWTATNTIARNSDYSQSGKEAYMSSQGSISQELLHQVKVNEDYIISLYGKGGSLTVYFGGVTRVIELGSSYTRHILRITPTTSTNTISFYGTYGTTLCDLMLEKGNVPSDWVPSVLDNHSELAKYETLTYLKNLLQVETSVDGSSVSTGIINTGLINMGHYDTNGKRVRVTAGLSGTYNNDNSVAFFGGGSLEQALQAVYMFDGNPSYQPTEAELANIAKVVITHGGRAILQDIILRGYIYAKGGVFNGTVYAKDGEFKGRVTATEGEFNGVVKTSLSYSKTGIIATDIYTINPQQEPISWFKVEPIGLQDDPRQIYLPSAALYDGLEITFFLAPSTRAAVHNHVVTALTEEKIVFPMNLVQVAIYSSTPTTEIIPTTVKTENATMLESQSVTMVCFGEVRFKAIASEKKWYAVSGSFTGE